MATPEELEKKRVEGFKAALAKNTVGRGRPKGSIVKVSDSAREKAKKMIFKEWKPLIEALIKSALGEIDVRRYNRKTKTWDIYRQPPDTQTGQFLISTVIGKTPTVDIDTGDTQPIYNINITKIDNKQQNNESSN